MTRSRAAALPLRAATSLSIRLRSASVGCWETCDPPFSPRRREPDRMGAIRSKQASVRTP
jgi:hypothetical protein